jgi:hypothetical protein
MTPTFTKDIYPIIAFQKSAAQKSDNIEKNGIPEVCPKRQN